MGQKSIKQPVVKTSSNQCIYLSILLVPISLLIYYISDLLFLSDSSNHTINTDTKSKTSLSTPFPEVMEWQSIPFVPCDCSVPQRSTKRQDANLNCAVLHDGTRAGSTSLSSQKMVVDGLQTIKNYVTKAEQTAILHDLNQYPFVDYAGKSCQEFGQNFSFYIDRFTADYLPPAVKALGDRLVTDGILTEEERPNYVLVNRYIPGQGIHPHVDDNYYTDGIVSVTLMSGGSLNFFRDKNNVYFDENPDIGNKYKPNKMKDKLLECGAGYFEPGSLFAMHREGRYAYKHEMKRRYKDRVTYAKRNKRTDKARLSSF